MTDTNPGKKLLDLEVPAEVWLAAEELPMHRLLDLEPGGVLALSRDPDEPVDLVVNGTVMASGELVVVDGRFGLRITSTGRQKLAALGENASTPDPEPAIETPDTPATEEGSTS